MNRGKFITFEGNDGCGKTTISNRIYNELKNEGYDVMFTREPGGISISEKIRSIILDPQNTEMDARCEALLYAAARRQHLVEKVLPALANGTIVLCDRFIDSSVAYQGVARGLGVDEILEINEFAIEGNMPDATVLLHINAEKGLERIEGRTKKDRLDKEALTFHKKVEAGYQLVAEQFPQRIKLVDASKNENQVFKEAYAIVKKVVDEA